MAITETSTGGAVVEACDSNDKVECSMYKSDIREAVAGCAILAYLAGSAGGVSMNIDKLVIARALLTGPDHEFAKSELDLPLADGDTPTAQNQRFSLVVRDLSEDSRLGDAFSRLYAGPGRRYSIDRQAMRSVCAGLVEMVEGTTVVIKDNKRRHSDEKNSMADESTDSSESSNGVEEVEARGWQDYGNCLGTDPELFFPERGASTREAKEVCKGCVVREECLEYALANGEKFGIWGGLSERERRRIRRQRSLARRTVLELSGDTESASATS